MRDGLARFRAFRAETTEKNLRQTDHIHQISYNVVSNKQHHESADREAVMSGKWGRMFAGVMIALPLGACITMQKKEDGKTHISIPNPLAGLLKG